MKPGYLLRVFTHKPGDDDSSPHDIEGLEARDLPLYVMIIRLFDELGLGGRHVTPAILNGDLARTIRVFGAQGNHVPVHWDADLDPELTRRMGDDFYVDHILEIIGTHHSGFYWRIYDYHEIYLIPPGGLEDLSSDTSLVARGEY